MKNRKVDPWMQTFTGKKFRYDIIKPENICIEDIAHSLALQCRYTGHTRIHYSVAQHSVIVSMILPDKLALAGLLHDATEAYLHDINKPFKDYLNCEKYKQLDTILTGIIYNKFGLKSYHFDHPEIKKADLILLRAEASQVLTHPPIDDWHIDLPKKEILIDPWPWQLAEKLFLKRFNELK